MEEKILDSVLDPSFVDMLLKSNPLNLLLVIAGLSLIMYFIYKNKISINDYKNEVSRFNVSISEYLLSAKERDLKYVQMISEVNDSIENLGTFVKAEVNDLKYEFDKDISKIEITLKDVEREIIRHTSTRCGSFKSATIELKKEDGET